MLSRHRKLSVGLERLENRELMAVDISVVRGDLYIKGTAAGEVAIVDLGDGTLQITEKGAAEDGSDVVTVQSGVTDDIFIRLDSAGVSTNDAVTLDLSAGSVAIDQVFAATKIDPWYLRQIELINVQATVIAQPGELSSELLRTAKSQGFSDSQIAALRGVSEDEVRKARHHLGIRPVYKHA